VFFDGVDYETKTSLFKNMNEINLSLVGARLKDARKQLGINQAEAADLVGVTREHWGRCERGLGMPGGEVLAALAAAGADILYILTGQRSQPVQEAAGLPPRQRALLANYEGSDEAGKKIIEGTASLAAQQPTRKKA